MTTRIERSAALACALAILAGVACAQAPDPAASAMLHKLKASYPATRFTQVLPTPIAGVFEVVMGPNVAYVASDGRHFLFGHLFDMQAQRDLTADRQAAADAAPPAARIAFDTLPLDDAVKTVHGNGSRRLAVFSDPRCGYCQALESEIVKLDNLTVYTFLLPWLGAESRAAAELRWAEAMPQRANDRGVLDRNLALASRLGLRGTPMLITADGRISEGARSAPALEAWLAGAGALARAPSQPDKEAE